MVEPGAGEGRGVSVEWGQSFSVGKWKVLEVDGGDDGGDDCTAM
jgi:hypothetical protein